MINESMFSPLWYRYAKLKPKFKPTINTYSQTVRDNKWFVLHDNQTQQQLRINDIAYQFAGRLDGNFTVQEIWDAVIEVLGKDAPTQPEIIHLLNQLDQNDLIVYDIMPQMARVFKRGKKTKSFNLGNVNPLSFKLSLGNPEFLLNRLQTLAEWIYSPWTLIVWLIAVMSGAILVTSNWALLGLEVKKLMLESRFAIYVWLSFPIMKFFHELAHALAVKKWGGKVSEWGLTFFILTPSPYVDASAASAFSSKWQRALVSAAGIMTDLLIASFAFFVYFNVRPGMVQDVALVMGFVSSFSSIAVNGNPLLKFDAYHVLSDIIEINNLASKSRDYWAKKISAFFSILPSNIQTLEGETKWLVAYMPLSTIYSLTLLTSIVLWVGEKSSMLGLIACFYVLVMMILKPLYQYYQTILDTLPPNSSQLKAKVGLNTVFALLVLLFLVLPMPYASQAKGVIWLPDEAFVRSETEGFLQEIVAHHGDLVTSGQVLVKLENPEFKVKEQGLISQQLQLEAAQFDAMMFDPTKGSALGEKLSKTKLEIARMHEHMDALTLHSKTKGYWVMPNAQDVLNSYIKQGQLIGYVFDQSQIRVRVAVPAEDADLMHEDISRIEIKTVDHLDQTYLATLINIKPLASNKLPSPALGSEGGGDFVTDPKDKEGLTVSKPVVWIDLAIPNLLLDRAGGGVYVKFVHSKKPLSYQAYRYFKQLFISRFDRRN